MKKILVAMLIATMMLLLALGSADDVTKSTTTATSTNPSPDVTKSSTTTTSSALGPDATKSTTTTTSSTPGFEATFALAGILAVAFLDLRRRT